MQKMMLRWEQFHPLNAAHVVELGSPVTAAEVEQAVLQTSRGLGLNPVEFCPRLRGFRFPEALDADCEEPLPFEHWIVANPDAEALRQILNNQLNRPFSQGVHWPLRFLLIETPSNTQYLAIVYQHVVSDSRGISLILRELLRTLYREESACGELVFYPPHLQQLFPRDLGWSNLRRLAGETIQEFTASAWCYRPGQRTGESRQIDTGLHALHLPIGVIKQTAKQHAVKVQDILFASFLEAMNLLLQEELSRTRRKTLAAIAPVDLRRESPENMEAAFTQLLGSINVRLQIRPGTPFSQIVLAVAEQTQASKQHRSYRTHAAQLETMSRAWDCSPRWLNQSAGPAWFPYLGLISNVNLTDFFSDQLKSGVIRNYFRFTGTGILVPMMLGVTTVGPIVNITTTHHTDEYRRSEIQRLSHQIELRITGQLADHVSRGEFLNRKLEAAPVVAEPLVA